MYIFQANVARKPFYTALSTKQVKQYKLSIKQAVLTIGDTQSSQETKKRIMAAMPKPAELAKLRAISNVYRAERRLKKLLAKGGESGE